MRTQLKPEAEHVELLKAESPSCKFIHEVDAINQLDNQSYYDPEYREFFNNRLRNAASELGGDSVVLDHVWGNHVYGLVYNCRNQIKK